MVREISKLHEEVVRGSLADFPGFTVKGEFVIVVEGAKEKENALNALPIPDHVEKYIAEGLSKMDAVKRVAADRNRPKSGIYAEYEKAKKE